MEIKPGNGKMPKPRAMIAWGGQYKAWSDPRKIIYLEKLASSLNEALDMMQTERNECLVVNAALEKRVAIAIRSSGESRLLMQQQITTHNLAKQEMLTEIESLRREVRDSRGDQR